jgi:hypothetical protein
MKKLVVCLFATVYVLTCQAQLKIYPSGDVNIGGSTQNPTSHLTISDNSASSFPYNVNSNVKAGLASFAGAISNYNYGVFGTCFQTNGTLNNLRNYGIYGFASSANSSSCNYGVFGCQFGKGAAVYGETFGINGTDVNGHYAGYFHGDTYTTGTATITNLVQPSDERLKEDIICLSDDRSDIHSRMMDVDVISYRYKPYFFVKEEDVEEVAKHEEPDRRIHFGVSAQQLLDLFPELVTEGQDGYLAVNYQELVPMLICSVQQLQRELDDLRGLDDRKNAAQDDDFGNSTDISVGFASECHLYQNNPNPFAENTVIKYSVPSDASNAWLYVFDMQGTMLKQMQLDTKANQIMLQGGDLKPGMYLYSLIVNGKEIDTKKMILSK